VDGVAIVTGQLGAAVGTAAIVAEWSTGKVQQVTLARSGAAYTGAVAPFLTGLQQPVPVILAPDGSLVAGDDLPPIGAGCVPIGQVIATT